MSADPVKLNDGPAVPTQQLDAEAMPARGTGVKREIMIAGDSVNPGSLGRVLDTDPGADELGSVARVAGAGSTDAATSGTISANGETVELTGIQGRSAGSFTVSGTWDGDLVIEATTDGVTWYPLVSWDTTNNVTTTVLDEGDNNSRWLSFVGGAVGYRLRATAWTSGDADIELRAGSGASGFIGSMVTASTAGGATAANQVVGNAYLASIETNTTPLTRAQGSVTAGQTGPLIQGAVTAAAPAYGDGETQPLSLTPFGAVRVSAAPATTAGAPAGVTVSTSAVVLAAANASRKLLALTNNGLTNVFLGITGAVTASGATMGLKLSPNGSLKDLGEYFGAGDVYAISDGANATQNVSVLERT